jgi:hypothetical protein
MGTWKMTLAGFQSCGPASLEAVGDEHDVRRRLPAFDIENMSESKPRKKMNFGITRLPWL